MVDHIGEDPIDKDDNVISHVWKDEPKPTDEIWEPNRWCDKSFWSKYSASKHYLDHFPNPTGWGDDSEEGPRFQHLSNQENMLPEENEVPG